GARWPCGTASSWATPAGASSSGASRSVADARANGGDDGRPVVISVRGVSKVFTVGKGEQVALQDADLEVRQGDFVSLIGPSGCGKTTLMRLIADLIEPTTGTIDVAGKTPRQAREDREYGYVFQAPVLYEWRTVLANVTLPLEIMGYDKARRRERARELLKLVGLERFGRSYPWQLSGGMQQRVSI